MGIRRRRRKRRNLDSSRLTRRQRRSRDKRAGRTGARSGGVRRAGLPLIAAAARIGLGIVRSPIGKRLLTVARQRLSRIPGFGRFGRTTRAARSRTTGLATTTTRAVATTRTSTAKTIAKKAVVLGAGGFAFEGGSRILDAIAGGRDVARSIGKARGKARGIAFTPGAQVPTDSITHTWVANGVPFAQLADGRVMVRRKNGTIKIFRRPRPIVLGRNPTVRQLVRADKKIDKVLKLVRKRMPAARRQHSKTHP